MYDKYKVTKGLAGERHVQNLSCKLVCKEGDNQSAIFKISDSGTLELAAAVVEAPRTECALKISLLTPEAFKRERSHLAKGGAEIGL